MNIIEKYNPQIGDEVKTNIDGRHIYRKYITGIIGKIDNDNDCLYILNNEFEGSTYDEWRSDAIRYGKEFSWKVDINVSDEAFFEILRQEYKLYKFLLRKK